MANINFDVDSNSIENKSQVVLRTNPYLTTNVKLVVDSDNELYLESFSANRVLANQQYKKFNIDSNGHYAYDLKEFFKDAPVDKLYDLWRTDSDDSVYTVYEKQYEEQYQYGARLNDSKLYDNNIRFLAPLWLDTDLPEYFVVYRIDEPVSQEGLVDSYDGINDRLMDMLKNAELVATFDMRKSSKIGTYLNTYVNDPKFPYSPLTVSFERDQKTSWNGIDLVSGGFVSKGEYIYNDFIVKDHTEILGNQVITEGFRRNKLACANLINLEFIFDDSTVEAYDVNRYIGFYVKAHTEGQFKAIDYKKGILRVDLNTVSSTYDLTSTSLTDADMLPNNDLDFPVLQWIKNRGRFFNVLNDTTYVSQGKYKIPGMVDEVIGGYVKKEDTLQVETILSSVKDFLKIEVTDYPISGERWIVASKSEWDAIGDQNYFTITADNTLAVGKAANQRFSTLGKLEQVAFAISNAIKQIQDNPFNVWCVGTTIYIEHNSVGNRLRRSFFAERNTNTSNSIQVSIGESDNLSQSVGLAPSVYADWDVFYPIGGSNSSLGFLVDSKEVGDVNTNTFIKTRDEKYHRIVDVVEDPYNSGMYRVCLGSRTLNTDLVYGTSFNLYVESYIEWGKFEAFDFIDFDFDFYSTSNSEPKELQYETSEDISLSSTVLLPEHFTTTTSTMFTALEDYYNQLEGIKGKVTPFSTGITYINSEYDRLKENYLKETSTLSRTVPFIHKWAYKEAVNAKEKPYYLSTSEAFGKTNFSPDMEISGRSPKAMTHEWFYLYKYPTYSTIPQTASGMGDLVRNFYSYIQPDETVELTAADLMSINEDWFNRLFVYEGINIDNVWVPAETTRKYSTFIKGSPFAPSETMFRGLKIKAYARKEFTESNPRNLINTADFNDYKFSAVLNYNYNATEELTYKIIQNKKWKTITFYIELNTSEENLNYLNRRLLYQLDNFLDSSANYVTSQVSGNLDFSTCYSEGSNYVIVNGINTAFLRDIQIDENGGYGKISFTFLGYNFELTVLDVLSDMTLKLATEDSLGNVSDIASPPNVLLNLPSITYPQTMNIQVNYNAGGYGLAASMLENVSIKYITDLINANDTDTIKYLTVEEDGTVLENRFIINIEDGNSFVKNSSLTYAADPLKPKSYKVSSSLIGYIVQDSKTPTRVNMIRLNGEYSPAWRKVVSFTDLYKENKLQLSLNERQERVYSKFNRLGIAFASYDNFGIDHYGIVKNYFYHKINPEKADGILKLSQSGDALPKYPLINEIAIDKRDINVFRSSWEDGFYTKNGTQDQKINVFGTLSANEESAFLASTLNLPKDSYYISSYSGITTVKTFQELKSLKTSGNFKGQVAIFEDDSNVWIDLYLKTNLVNILVNDNAGLSIKKYVNVSQSYGDKSTLDDDIKQYIEVNLLKLMGIEEVRVWNVPAKGIQSSTVLSADSLQSILDTNAQEEKSFRVEYDSNQPLNVRLIYNKRPGFKHQFYVYVKISS